MNTLCKEERFFISSLRLFINFFFVLFAEKHLIFSGKGAEIKRFLEIAGS